MTAQRCPHCHAELPERASFCGACGRRIEGWSSLPATDKSDAPLPGSQEATRQMEPTPSLLRVARLERQKREDKKKQATQPRAPAPVEPEPVEPQPIETESMMLRAIRRARAPMWIAMVGVALAGAAGGFLLVKQHRRARVAVAPEPEPPPMVTPAGVPPPTASPPAPATIAAPPTGIAAAPSPLRLVKSKRPRAHRLTPLEVPVAQKHAVKPPKGNGLPHKAVATDSRPAQAVNTRTQAAPPPAGGGELQEPYPTVQVAPQAPPQQLAMPSVQHDDPAREGEPPASAEDDKREASARIDADGVRLVVKQHLPQVHACYGRAFKNSSPGGRIEVGFAINQSGRAESVRTEVNTTDSVELARCLETRLREWQFPRPVGGDYELIYPFVFAPGS